MKERPICIAAHARAATKGHVNLANTHPFEAEDKIVGMHNGTIHGKFPGSTKFDTDSEAMFNLIAKNGLREALTEMHKEATTMAYAIASYNINDGVMSIIRNYARPMFIAKHKTNKAKMFWASEKSFLLFALLRAGIITDYEIEELKVNSLLTFSPYCVWAKEDEPKYGVNIEEDWFKVPTKTEYTTRDSGWWKHNNTYYSGPEYKGGRNQRGSQTMFDYDGMPPKDSLEVDTKTKEKEKEKTSVREKLKKDGVPSVFKIGDKYETVDELLYTLGCGCQVCGNPSTIINNNWKKFKFEYGKSKDFICDTCTDKHNDDLLACEYGLVNLVQAKPAD
jgi:hypothetical protein